MPYFRPIINGFGCYTSRTCISYIHLNRKPNSYQEKQQPSVSLYMEMQLTIRIADGRPLLNVLRTRTFSMQDVHMRPMIGLLLVCSSVGTLGAHISRIDPPNLSMPFTRQIVEVFMHLHLMGDWDAKKCEHCWSQGNSRHQKHLAATESSFPSKMKN